MPRPFETKFKRSNSGLFYLIVIGLAAALAANVFRKDDGILLLPIAIVVLAMIGTLVLRRYVGGER